MVGISRSCNVYRGKVALEVQLGSAKSSAEHGHALSVVNITAAPALEKATAGLPITLYASRSPHANLPMCWPPYSATAKRWNSPTTGPAPMAGARPLNEKPRGIAFLTHRPCHRLLYDNNQLTIQLPPSIRPRHTQNVF